MSFQTEVGIRLRNLRESRNLSRQDVQIMTNGQIKESILAMYENGRRRIPTPRLKELSDFYSVTLSFLLGENPNMFNDAQPKSLEAILKSDESYSEDEKDLLFHVINIINAKRKAEGRE